MNERITKSRSDKLIAGVCGGLADYFGVDPVLVRLAFVVVTLLWGAGVLVYLVLAVIMPAADGPDPGHTLQRSIDDLSQEARGRAREVAEALRQSSRRRRNAFAAILIAAGVLLLAGHLGAFLYVTWFVLAPLLLIALGIAVLLGIFQPPQPS